MRRTSRHPAEVLTEATHDHSKQLELHGWRDFTGALDLEAFLATHGEQRAAVWLAASADDRRGLVMQALRAAEAQFDNAEVETYVAKYNARYGDALPATEAAVAGALERLAEQEAMHARCARAAGEREHAKGYQRAANSYARALVQFRAGVRPESLGTNKWLLPSKRGQDEAPHILTLDGGTWVCTCQAGATDHWARSLIIAQELAFENPHSADFDDTLLPFEPTGDIARDITEAEQLGGDCDRHGSYAGPSCPRCAAAALGRRLAQRRAQVYASVYA